MTTTAPDTTGTWSLDALFKGPDDPALTQAYADIDAALTRFEGCRDELTDTIAADRFVALCDDLDAMSRATYRIYAYAGLAFAADTTNQQVQALQGQADRLIADSKNRTLFFQLWWKDLADDAANRLLDASGDYRYWLEQLRNARPYTLSEAEERVINVKNITGATAFNKIYATITNAYEYRLTVNGDTKTLTRGELMNYVRTTDADLRAAAYQVQLNTFGDSADVLGMIYQNIVRSWSNEGIELRGHASPIAVRNRISDLPDDVIETMFDVVRRNNGTFQRFFRLKAKLLGVQKLRRYDIYAPVSNLDKQYTFGEAVDLTMDAFNRFDPSFGKHAQQVLDENRVDSQVRPGKREGAFCWTVNPDLTPWVLVNFDGKYGDVSTLAHELGHAVHGMLARHHSQFTAGPCLPLAETASTFGEMTLADLVMEREADPVVQRDILITELEGAYATIARQLYFARFEQQAHQMIMDGASVPELNAAYLANLHEQFGDAVDVSDDFQYEWLSIPHFYASPFYVYAYSFGQLLTYALYQRYLDEGADFVPKYLEVLAAGGSVAPVELLARAGFDITTADFWQSGFDVLERKLKRLEQLCEQTIS